MKKLTKENLEKELNYIPCFTFLSDKGKNVDKVFGIIYNRLKNSDSEIINISAVEIGSFLGMERHSVYKAISLLLDMDVLVAFGGDKVRGYKIDFEAVGILSKSSISRELGQNNLSELLD